MAYINTTTTQYPISEQEIRNLYPNTSFSIPFQAPEDFVWVFPAPQPNFDPITQYVFEGPPVLTDKGHYEQTWSIGVLDAETIQANQAAHVEQVKTAITQAVQQRLDDFAKTHNFDGILSACTYATSAVPQFASDGQYAVNARDTTWATLYQIMTEVQIGVRPMPSGYADIEPDLPVLSWPQG